MLATRQAEHPFDRGRWTCEPANLIEGSRRWHRRIGHQRQAVSSVAGKGPSELGGHNSAGDRSMNM
jgi:hypothetical protein